MEKKHLFSLRSLPIGKILLLFLLIYIALLAIPYIQHKNVSVSYQKKFAKQSFYSDTAGTERVAYINDNTDALLYRLHMLDEAKDEIILSTFDFNADKSGQDMMASLLHAADRGVSVRILVDGISGFLDVKRNSWFQALASHENVSIRIYNPINLLKPWNLQARMHDKYVIVDQKCICSAEEIRQIYFSATTPGPKILIVNYLSMRRQKTTLPPFASSLTILNLSGLFLTAKNIHAKK